MADHTPDGDPALRTYPSRHKASPQVSRHAMVERVRFRSPRRHAAAAQDAGRVPRNGQKFRPAQRTMIATNLEAVDLESPPYLQSLGDMVAPGTFARNRAPHGMLSVNSLNRKGRPRGDKRWHHGRILTRPQIPCRRGYRRYDRLQVSVARAARGLRPVLPIPDASARIRPKPISGPLE